MYLGNIYSKLGTTKHKQMRAVDTKIRSYSSTGEPEQTNIS